jgi:hypothetical protein
LVVTNAWSFAAIDRADSRQRLEVSGVAVFRCSRALTAVATATLAAKIDARSGRILLISLASTASG